MPACKLPRTHYSIKCNANTAFKSTGPAHQKSLFSQKPVYEKITLLCVLLFFSLSLTAQYQSIFGQNGTSWTFWEITLGASYTDSLFTGKDTVVYGKVYKQVHLNAPNIRLHIIREDTTTGSIFLSDYIYSGKEIETMNMTLAVGDSFCSEYVSIDSCNAWSWKKVDSVYYEDGRKIIQFDHLLPTFALPDNNWRVPVKWKFIEGIGPNNQGGVVKVLVCSFAAIRMDSEYLPMRLVRPV